MGHGGWGRQGVEKWVRFPALHVLVIHVQFLSLTVHQQYISHLQRHLKLPTIVIFTLLLNCFYYCFPVKKILHGSTYCKTELDMVG